MARNKGNNEKLTRKEKQELKKDGEKMKEQIKTIVLPTFLAIAFFIVAYVFMKTRSMPLPSAE